MRTALTALFALTADPRRQFELSPDHASMAGKSRDEMARMILLQLYDIREMMVRAGTSLHMVMPILTGDDDHCLVNTSFTSTMNYNFIVAKNPDKKDGHIRLELAGGESARQRNIMIGVKDFRQVEKVTDRFAIAAASLLKSYGDDDKIRALPGYVDAQFSL